MRNKEDIMDLREVYVAENDEERLDSYLTKELKEFSRTYIHRLIKNGLVSVNGKKKLNQDIW